MDARIHESYWQKSRLAALTNSIGTILCWTTGLERYPFLGKSNYQPAEFAISRMDCTSSGALKTNNLTPPKTGGGIDFLDLYGSWKWPSWCSLFDLRAVLVFVKLWPKHRTQLQLCLVARSVYVDKCPVHTMATWIRHLLTKVQQMKLMRSIFRCCAWLEKEWH